MADRPKAKTTGGSVRVTRAVTETQVRLETGAGPHGGLVPVPYVWDDVLETAAPARRGIGEGQYAIHHHIETGRDLRVAYSTAIHVRTEDGVIEIEETVAVERRFLLSLMDRYRALSDRVAARARAALARSLAAQRRRTLRARWKWVGRAVAPVIRAEARAGHATIRFSRAVAHGLVEVPDRLALAFLRAGRYLGHRFGRATLRRGLSDPAALTLEQKGVVLFLAALGLFGLILLLNTVFALIFPEYATLYRQVFRDAAVTFGSTVALPVPPEILLIGSAVTIGLLAAFVGPMIGKMVGVWALYILGDALNKELRKASTGRPRLERTVVWIRENANTRGLPALFVLNFVPGLPDLLMYAFAASGMRFRPYFVITALATAAKFAIILALVFFLGPDRVLYALQHPIATITGG